MIVRLWDNFGKKSNSTKIPDNSMTYRQFEGTLKAPSTITNPNIILRFDDNTFNPANYSFAYIPDFDRYYHVSEWTWDAGYWSPSLSVDVLASFKNDILNQSAYIIYSSSDYNINLIDRRLTNNAKPTIASSAGTMFSELTMSNNGCFALNVVSDEGRWGVATYILNGLQLTSLMEVLCIEDSTEFTDQMQQLFAGASINSIISCTWFPWLHESSIDTVHVGAYDTGVQCQKIDYCEYYVSGELNIPWVYDDWRRSPSYMTLTLYLPFYGVTTLPLEQMLDATSINVRCCIDYSTGGGTYYVQTNGGKVVAILSFNIGCNIPISGMSVDPYGALKSSINTASSALSLNFGATTDSAFETLQNLAMPQTTISGAFGQSRSNASVINQVGTGQVLRCWLTYYDFSDNPADMASNIGRPSYKVRQLKGLSGYVKTANYSADCGLESETQLINNLLNGGVYIE